MNIVHWLEGRLHRTVTYRPMRLTWHCHWYWQQICGTRPSWQSNNCSVLIFCVLWHLWKGFKDKPLHVMPCLNAYSKASICLFKLSLHWLPQKTFFFMLYEWSNIGRRSVQFKPRWCRRCWDPVLQIGSLIVSHKKSTNRKVFLKNSRYLVYFCWGLHLWPLLTLAARLRASSNENIPSKAVPPQNNTWNPISIKGTF